MMRLLCFFIGCNDGGPVEVPQAPKFPGLRVFHWHCVRCGVLLGTFIDSHSESERVR